MRLFEVNVSSLNDGFFYIRLGFECTCATFSRQYLEVFSKVFTRATESGRSKGGCNFVNILPSMYQNVKEGKFIFVDNKLSKSSVLYYLEPGLHPFITDFVEAMNTLIQERHNHSERCITIKVSRKTQQIEFYLPNERSGPAFFSTDLGQMLGSSVDNEFVVILRGKRPHKPDFAYDIVRIHSLMVYMDLIEYSIVGGTKAPMLRFFNFLLKLKAGDIKATGHYMNYQPFSNLQFRPLIKTFSHSIHIDIRDTSSKKIPFISVGVTRLVLISRKASNIHF